MKLSLNTGAFAPDQLSEALAWTPRLALDGIELSPKHAQRMFESVDIKRAALDTFKRLGVRPLSVHAWTQVEGLPQLCPFTAEIGAGLIVVHCSDAAIARDFANQVEQLTQWQTWCAEHGVILTVENSSFQPLPPFVRLFEAVPGLRMTLDIKHAYKPEKLGLTHADYLEALGDRVANLHLSGIDRARDVLGDGVPPGNDAVDWDALACELAQRGYDGLATIEWTYPTHLTPQEIEAAYADIASPIPGASTVSQRLSAWCAAFYHDKLASLL